MVAYLKKIFLLNYIVALIARICLQQPKVSLNQASSQQPADNKFCNTVIKNNFHACIVYFRSLVNRLKCFLMIAPTLLFLEFLSPPCMKKRCAV